MSQIEPIMPEFYHLPFIKMQALGNDLIFLDGQTILQSAARPLLSQWQTVAPALAKELCNRRLSIGADGLILALPLMVPELAELALQFYGPVSKDCQLSWTYHNSDGSISDMCGNGLRCLSLWAHAGKQMSSHLQVVTALGAIKLDYTNNNKITVTLGGPKLKAGEIPFLSKSNGKDNVIKELFKLGSMEFPITCVNVGNPHCVIFEADFLNNNLFKTLGKQAENDRNYNNFFPAQLIPIAEAIETNKRFPEQTNIEFVNVIDRKHIQVFVWERGSKATLACGSGAVAAVIASILENRTDKQVKVSLPGGDLVIEWLKEDIITMTGEANISFAGEIDIHLNKLKAQIEQDFQAKVSIT